MRIAGLATGMDINQMVSDLMKAQRLPIDKMMQDRQIIQWQMEDYREINRKLNTFHTNIFDTVMRASSMTAKNVASTNEGLVSATASAAAGNMTLRVSKISQLAAAASYSSRAVISSDPTAKISSTGALGEQKFAEPQSDPNAIWNAGIVNRQNITQATSGAVVETGRTDIINEGDMIVKVGDKVYNVSTVADSASDTTVELDTATGKLTFNKEIAAGTTISTVFITEAPANSTDPKHKYTTAGISAYDENGVLQKDKFIFTSDQSLNIVFNELNRSKIGVTGFYDEGSDKVNISRTKTGVFNPNGNEITFEGDFLTKTLALDSVQASGAQNAKFSLNGLETERRSNTFTVSGVTVNLKGTTKAANGTDTGEVISLTSSTDTNKVFDTIKKFIDEYNELLDFTNGKLIEERHRDYRPLTDEQKDALSEKEVERWEERARSGLLRNDSTLRNQFDRMRIDLYSPVSGALDTAFNQLSAIGITTSSNYMERGKLEINEDKLRQAIEQDAEGVFQLFRADGESFSEKGIARRVRETLDGAINSLADRAGGFRGKVQNNQFTLGRNLDNINDRISNFERRLQQVEDRYWRQFNAMDAAVNQANKQAETLFSQLMGNQGQ